MIDTNPLMTKPTIYSNNYEINTGEKMDDKRAESIAQLTDTIQNDKAQLNTMSNQYPLDKSTGLVQSLMLDRRKRKEYMLSILDSAANPDLDALLALFEQQRLESPMTVDEIAAINEAIVREPSNYSKTKYITPHIELIDHFLITRTHPDSPELFVYMSLPLGCWDMFDVQVKDVSVMTDANPRNAWVAFSNHVSHQGQMFNPSKPAHVIRNEIFQLAMSIVQNMQIADINNTEDS